MGGACPRPPCEGPRCSHRGACRALGWAPGSHQDIAQVGTQGSEPGRDRLRPEATTTPTPVAQAPCGPSLGMWAQLGDPLLANSLWRATGWCFCDQVIRVSVCLSHCLLILIKSSCCGMSCPTVTRPTW